MADATAVAIAALARDLIRQGVIEPSADFSMFSTALVLGMTINQSDAVWCGHFLDAVDREMGRALSEVPESIEVSRRARAAKAVGSLRTAWQAALRG